jgi:hypothetical protein
MNEFLTKLMNQEVDVVCAASDEHYKGRVKTCVGGVVTLEADGQLTHIAIDKIISLTQR